VSIALNPDLVAQSLVNRLTQADTNIFDRVVGIDFQIALALDNQIEKAVSGESIEHVVEKADPGLDTALATAVKA